MKGRKSINIQENYMESIFDIMSKTHSPLRHWPLKGEAMAIELWRKVIVLYGSLCAKATERQRAMKINNPLTLVLKNRQK